jgi:hypothetical protein
VPEPCVVLIGAPDLLPSLRVRAGAVNGDILEFSHLDALPALEAIARRRPQVVVLERLFAMTARGAALINRIKADPSLRDAEIRVLAHDSDYTRVIPRSPQAPSAAPGLDNTGTRRAPRFRMAGRVDVVVEGKSARLVDLSTVGAQVLTPVPLKPNQEIVMALPGEDGTVQFNAKVAWTKFEVASEGAASYRAGVDFVDADPAAVDVFLQRRKA